MGASLNTPLRRCPLARVGGARQTFGRDQDRVVRAESRGREGAVTLLFEQAERVGRQPALNLNEDPVGHPLMMNARRRDAQPRFT
jgi:hypothetical protein